MPEVKIDIPDHFQMSCRGSSRSELRQIQPRLLEFRDVHLVALGLTAVLGIGASNGVTVECVCGRVQSGDNNSSSPVAVVGICPAASSSRHRPSNSSCASTSAGPRTSRLGLPRSRRIHAPPSWCPRAAAASTAADEAGQSRPVVPRDAARVVAAPPTVK